MIEHIHNCKTLSRDELEELFSNFLIDSWSYSKVSSFSRNEKAFEMTYIYRNYGRRSASEVAGTAYHAALKFYFSEKKQGRLVDIASLQFVAYETIDQVKPGSWKLQKTTPSIEECRAKANKSVTGLLKNFMEEISLYEDDIDEIEEVELYCDEFLTVNGVDIPIPCHGVLDLVVKTKRGTRAIPDHKSKAAFSDEKELKFSIGRQAIVYALLYETRTGKKVDEVWFVENKISENRDKSRQLAKFCVELTEDNRKLFQSLLYEPLKRMIEAVSNPDYVYLINESDNYVDKAEIYEFWSRTQIAEIGDFDIPENKKDIIAKRLKKIRDASIGNINPNIIKKFQENAAAFIQYDLTNKNMTKPEMIEHTLRTFNLPVRVAHVFNGYSSDTFLLEVSQGTNISSVYKYRLDIANVLSVPSVRILKDLFVHEGRAYLAIESERKRDGVLSFDDSRLVDSKIPIGLDNFKNLIYWDLDNPSSPHVLVCGSTGSGKSIFLISTLEYARLLGMDEIIIFDPKYEKEFLIYKKEGSGVKIYNEIEEIENKMESLVNEMNDLVKTGKTKKTLIIFDEFADAVLNSKKGKELEVIGEVQDGYYKPKKLKGPMGDYMSAPEPKFKMAIIETKKSLEENTRILLQKGRSTGYRIIAAMQRASVKVITGDAKVNFPVQICFKVPKEIDSIVVLDEPGAESLSGKGDGLIKSPEYPGVVRFQGFYKHQS